MRPGQWFGLVPPPSRKQAPYLDHARTRPTGHASITAADLTALAIEYLVPEHTARFVLKPAAH